MLSIFKACEKLVVNLLFIFKSAYKYPVIPFISPILPLKFSIQTSKTVFVKSITLCFYQSRPFSNDYLSLDIWHTENVFKPISSDINQVNGGLSLTAIFVSSLSSEKYEIPFCFQPYFYSSKSMFFLMAIYSFMCFCPTSSSFDLSLFLMISRYFAKLYITPADPEIMLKSSVVVLSEEIRFDEIVKNLLEILRTIRSRCRRNLSFALKKFRQSGLSL